MLFRKQKAGSLFSLGSRFSSAVGYFSAALKQLGFKVNVLWHRTKIPDNAKPGEHFQRVVADINFPPIEALTCRVHVAVVIVVPAFAERDHGQNEAVTAGIGRFEAAMTKNVGQGIDEKRAVKQEHGANEEAPHKKLEAVGAETRSIFLKKPADGPKTNPVDPRNHLIVAIQEHEFWKFSQILDATVVGREVSLTGDPTNVGPQKAVNLRGVSVFLFVRMLVMVAMDGSPPEGSALHGGISPESEDKLR